MTGKLHRNETLRADERGSDLIEYGLVAALLALCALSSTTHLVNIVENTFNNVANAISNAL